MNNIWLIARREFISRIATKATIIGLIIFAVIFIGGGAILGYFKPFDSMSITKVALTDKTATIAVAFTQADQQIEESLHDTKSTDTKSAGEKNNELDTLNQEFDHKYETDVMSQEEAREAVIDETVDFAVIGSLREPIILSKEDPSFRTKMLITQIAASSVLADEVTKLGGNIGELQKTVSKVKVRTEILDDGGVSATSKDIGAFITAAIVIFMLFGLIVACGQMVSMGVVEEKSSRIVEVLLSSVRPMQLLSGKILGITAMGLVQLLLMGASAILGIKLSGFTSSSDLSLSVISIWSIVWLLLGLATYMTLYAGIASTVSRMEDLSTVSTPILMMQIIPLYLIYFLLIRNPASEFLRILSLVPFFSCYAMPARQAFQSIPAWELLLSVGFNIAIIPLMIWLGAYIYRKGVLNVGARLKFSQIFAKA